MFTKITHVGAEWLCWHFGNILETTLLQSGRGLPTLCLGTRVSSDSHSFHPGPLFIFGLPPLLLPSVLSHDEQRTLGLVMKRPPPPQMEMIFSKAHFNWTWRSKSITVHSSVVMNMIYVYKLSRAASFFILMLWKPDMPQRKHLLETRMKERSGESHFIIKASLWCPRQSKA